MNPEISTVGVIGLGIMGGAYSKNLLGAGFAVCGYDTEHAPMQVLESIGGQPGGSVTEVVEKSEIVITSLPGIDSFHRVVSEIASTAKPDLVVIETSTLPIDDKLAAHKKLSESAIQILDCPVSGTGSQARSRDLSVYVSGDKDSSTRVEAVLEGIARLNFYVGEFGNGSKMKFIANHLVHIHNVASAEAMVLAQKAGMDPQLVYDVVSQGAGNSRIFELRAPMMVNDDYSDATMKMDVWQKDIKTIKQFADTVGCPMSLFDVCTEFYETALKNGQHKLDTASVCRVLEKQAGFNRNG